MKPETYRLLLFSTLAIMLAIIAAPKRGEAPRRHPLCELHPAVSSLCDKISSAFTPQTVPSDVISLTRSLMAVPSVSGTEVRAQQYAASWLEKHGWNVTTQTVPPMAGEKALRFNVLALRPGAAVSDVRVVLSTHLDTVPGAGRPASVKELEGGRLHGRGSVDAKGQAAGMMLAATILDDPRVALLLLSGEEVDHGGIKRAHELGFADDIVLVNGEPTESKLVTRQKGVAKVEIQVQGKAAHSGYPELGDSAVHKLVDFLAELRKVQWPMNEGVKTTLNVGEIRGGVAANVVAPSAWATLLFRLVGRPEEVLDELHRVMRNFENVSIPYHAGNPPFTFLVPTRAAEELGTTVVAYNTDVPAYKGKTRAAVLFGAGSITTAHTEDEYADVEELSLLPERLQRIVEEVLETEFP